MTQITLTEKRDTDRRFIKDGFERNLTKITNTIDLAACVLFTAHEIYRKIDSGMGYRKGESVKQIFSESKETALEEKLAWMKTTTAYLKWSLGKGDKSEIDKAYKDYEKVRDNLENGGIVLR